MSNTNISLYLSFVEKAAEDLDALVLDTLLPLRFSGSPENWSDEFDRLFADRYSTRVQDRKDAIHAVARTFRATGRTDDLLQSGSDIEDRVGIVRGTLAALDVLTCPELQGTNHLPFHLDRLRLHMPALRDVVRVLTDQVSRWQQDFRGWQSVFVVLEGSTLIGTLLESIPATIPETYVTQGQTFLDQIIRGWNDRKAIVEEARRLALRDEDPRPLLQRLDDGRAVLPSIINLFMDVVQQLDDLPTLRLLGRNHVARRFWEADGAYDRLTWQLDAMQRDVGRLEFIMDHFMGVADAPRPHY